MKNMKDMKEVTESELVDKKSTAIVLDGAYDFLDAERDYDWLYYDYI